MEAAEAQLGRAARDWREALSGRESQKGEVELNTELINEFCPENEKSCERMKAIRSKK
jgi:hypothetical protein